MIGEYLEQYTFEYLMTKALGYIPDTIDKREGSIIYDALAPACYELSEVFMEIRKILIDTYILTASEEYLDLKVQEQGITRYPATYASRLGTFLTTDGLPANVAIGARFSTINAQDSVNFYVASVYTVDGVVVPGSYILVCEELGTIGNNYDGNLIPITNVQGLAEAKISTILIPARDVETDEELRTRFLQRLNNKSFGGNVADYDQAIRDIAGVGQLQVYPVWNGGGTVKCSVISAEYETISEEFITQIQNMIDPTPQGTGLGTAPIGHTVTITTPTEVPINIVAKVTLNSSYTVQQLQSSIETAIEDYLLTLRKEWGVSNELNEYKISVYSARILMAILTVPGVANVSDITINGSTQDLTLLENAQVQQIPILGTVTLNG